MRREWAIIAPGPSAKGLTTENFRALGPVVAVNNAYKCPVPIDFWAVQDPAHRFEHMWGDVSPEHRHWGPIVWCPEPEARAWQGLGYRTWHHSAQEPYFKAEFVPRPAQLTYTGLTILVAIARAVGHGGRKIRLFGVDMAGEGYCYGGDNRHRDVSQWRSRWPDELRTFKTAQQHWESLGVEFQWSK